MANFFRSKDNTEKHTTNISNTPRELELIDAAQNNKVDMVKKLAKKKIVNVQHKENCGKTPLIYAAGCGYTEVCKILIKKGASVDMQAYNGITALMEAAAKGHYVICEILIEQGTSVNSKSNVGNSALIYAAINGHYETCKLLLEKGANIHLQNIDGYNALLISIAGNHFDTCRCLLDHGADASIKTNEGKSALDLSHVTKNEKIIKLIKKYLLPLKILEIKREIEIRKTKLDKIKECNQLKQQGKIKSMRNQEIEKVADFLLPRITETDDFLQEMQGISSDLSDFLNEQNDQRKLKVDTIFTEITANNQNIESYRQKIKQNNVDNENYQQLKQELEQFQDLEKCLTDEKNAEISEDTEHICPICMNDWTPPILQCSEGHVFCETCFDIICATTQECPFCKRGLDPNNRCRNRALEDLISNDRK